MSQRELSKRQSEGQAGLTHAVPVSLAAELEQTLTAAACCYLGLLAAALVYGLIVAALQRDRCCKAHPMEPLTRQGQGAALGSRVQVGRRCPPVRAPERKGPTPSGFHAVLRPPRGCPCAGPSLLAPASFLLVCCLLLPRGAPFFLPDCSNFSTNTGNLRRYCCAVVLGKGGGIPGPRPAAPRGGLSRVGRL